MKIRIAACLLVVCSIVSCAPSSEDGGSRSFQEQFKAAEQGDARAQNSLGVMYYNGEGVPQDDAEAVKWYRKAAEQGDAEAQYNLGDMYDNGEGVPQDDAEAVKWFRKAAEQGHAEAQYGLGFMYRYGKGVSQDDAKAYTWFAVAAANGHELAKVDSTEVKFYLNQDQLAVAQQRVTQLFEKINTKKK